MGEEEKNCFIALPSTGRHRGLLPWKSMCPNLGAFDEEFYSNSLKGGVADKIRVCAGFHMAGFLVLMSFSGSFNFS